MARDSTDRAMSAIPPSRAFLRPMPSTTARLRPVDNTFMKPRPTDANVELNSVQKPTWNQISKSSAG